MLTPRQHNDVLAAVKRHGLAEQDIEIKDSKSEMRVTHLATSFYFLLSINAPNSAPASLANAILVTYLPFQVSYTPNLLNPLLDTGHPVTSGAGNWEMVYKELSKWLAWIKKEYGPFDTSKSLAQKTINKETEPKLSLATLHPTIQAAASSLYATGHYRQALLDAFIAVDNAVRDKSQLTGSGTRLMETAFSPGNPVLNIGDSPDEQQGFLALFRGAMLAIRNPKAHSLNGTHDAQRALEWLSFASVLLRNLDEATLAQPTAISPTP
jgi:uncharacterized protein (TIGR02391 family)